MRPFVPSVFVTLGVAAALGSPQAVQAQGVEACWLARGTVEEAQERPSPLGAVEITLGGETATLCYGRPSARGREIMGGLVPFGTVWRMGANEATAIHLPFDAEIGGRDGVAVSAGTYSLYAVPGEEEWEIFINADAQRWGVPVSADVKAADIGSFTRPAERIDEMVETLTYRWDPHGEGMGHIILEWEHTRVEIPVHHGDLGM